MSDMIENLVYKKISIYNRFEIKFYKWSKIRAGEKNTSQSSTENKAQQKKRSNAKYQIVCMTQLVSFDVGYICLLQKENASQYTRKSNSLITLVL